MADKLAKVVWRWRLASASFEHLSLVTVSVGLDVVVIVCRVSFKSSGDRSWVGTASWGLFCWPSNPPLPYFCSLAVAGKWVIRQVVHPRVRRLLLDSGEHSCMATRHPKLRSSEWLGTAKHVISAGDRQSRRERSFPTVKVELNSPYAHYLLASNLCSRYFYSHVHR